MAEGAAPTSASQWQAGSLDIPCDKGLDCVDAIGPRHDAHADALDGIEAVLLEKNRYLGEGGCRVVGGPGHDRGEGGDLADGVYGFLDQPVDVGDQDQVAAGIETLVDIVVDRKAGGRIPWPGGKGGQRQCGDGHGGNIV